MQHYTLKVIDIRLETDDAVTIVFKQPGLKKIKYQSGQYITLILRINGRRYLRPYSFSSSPIVDTNLEITIKRVMGGVVSNHLIDQLKIDDVVEAMEPIGDFVLQEDSLDLSKHIVLWGAGSGITPLISIAKYALYKKLCGHVTLVYGNRNSESVIFKQTIQQLQNQYSNIFSSWHFYTKLVISPDNPQLLQGRIDPNKVLTVMKTDNDISNTVHYICGPQGLKVSVKSALLNLGVSAKNIFSEDFEVVRDPAEFKDITTQTVILNKSNQSFSVEVVKGKSILEAALDALIDLSYSCQTGNCLICKARLIKGNIKTVGVEQLADDLKHDERLLCCSFPLSGDVLLEVE